jgi:hypothetical protein
MWTPMNGSAASMFHLVKRWMISLPAASHIRNVVSGDGDQRDL